jgi:hypothetical protein
MNASLLRISLSIGVLILFVVFIAFGAVVLNAQEPVCTGNVSLFLGANLIVDPGTSILGAISGLTDCNDRNTSIHVDSCTGTVQCMCFSSPCSCSFNAPATPGSYTYYVCADVNGDGDTLDSGETDSKTITVKGVVAPPPPPPPPPVVTTPPPAPDPEPVAEEEPVEEVEEETTQEEAAMPEPLDKEDKDDDDKTLGGIWGAVVIGVSIIIAGFIGAVIIVRGINLGRRRF